MSFLSKTKAQQDQRRKKIQEKLKGEDLLYMGDPALHWGVGGWQRGRCNLTYGPKGSGKTTLSLKGAAAEQQKRGGYVVIFDSEGSHCDPNEEDLKGRLTERAQMYRDRYKKAGLDIEKIIVIGGSNRIGELFANIDDLESDIKNKKIDVCAIIVDSWGGVRSEHAVKKITGGKVEEAGNQPGGNVRSINPIIQTFVGIAIETGTTVFFVQHCMRDLDYGGWILLGGEKLKFLVHNVIFLESARGKESRLLADGTQSTKNTAYDVLNNQAIGKKVYFRCEKSRSVVEGRKGEFLFDFDNLQFALPEVSLFNLAVALGVIAHPKLPEVEGSGPNKGKPVLDENGRPKLKEKVNAWEFPVGVPTPRQFTYASGMMAALKEDKELFNAVYQSCLKSNLKDATTEEVDSKTKGKKRK